MFQISWPSPNLHCNPALILSFMIIVGFEPFQHLLRCSSYSVARINIICWNVFKDDVRMVYLTESDIMVTSLALRSQTEFQVD